MAKDKAKVPDLSKEDDITTKSSNNDSAQAKEKPSKPRFVTVETTTEQPGEEPAKKTEKESVATSPKVDKELSLIHI